MKKIILLIVLLLFNSSIFARNTKIAVIYTKAGIRATTMEKTCMTLAVLKHANLTDNTFEYKFFDNNHSIPKTIQVAKQIIEDKFDFAIGTYNSNEAKIASEVLNKANIPLLPPNATLTDLTKEGSFVLRFLNNDKKAIEILASYSTKELNPRKIVTLRNNSHLQQTNVEMNYHERMKSLNPNISITRKQIYSGYNEYPQLVSEIVLEKPDLIFLSIYSRQAARIYNELSKRNYNVNLIGGDGIGGNKRFLSMLNKIDSNLSLKFIRNWDGTLQGEYHDEFKMLLRKYCNEHTIQFTTVLAYDSTKFLLEAIKKFPDKRGKDFLNSVKTMKYHGLIGTLVYENGSVKRSLNLFTIDDDNLERKSKLFKTY